jgi:hypothetical protein
MAITAESTPNPNAVKFTVGRSVGGPATFVAGRPVDDPMAGELLAIDGITSIFMSADFVTISKTAEADWDDILPTAQTVLEARFG